MLDVYPNGDLVQEDDPSYGVPTKENMLKAIEWLVTDVREGDSLVFIFCGHMAQVLDYALREDERVEEALCPVDWSDFDGLVPYKLITDRELHRCFGKLPLGTMLTMILDASACTAPLRVPLKHVASALDREEDHEAVTQAMYNTASNQCAWGRSQHVNALPRRMPYTFWRPLWTSLTRLMEPATAAPLQEGCSIFCITACGLGQSAMEAWIDGLQQGILTYCLLQVLRNQKAGTFWEWIQAATQVAKNLQAKVIPDMDQHFEIAYGRHVGPEESKIFDSSFGLLAKDRAKRRRGQVFLPT